MIVTIFETLALVVPVALFTWALKGQIDTMRAETKRERERLEAMWADLEREQADALALLDWVMAQGGVA